MEPSIGVTGPLPRSEAVVAVTRDLDRGRATEADVEAAYTAAEQEVLATETKLGLAPFTGGYLRWPDLFRPFSVGWPGFEVGPLTRWFETNTFYRQPVLQHPPERTPGRIAPWLPAATLHEPAERFRVILPGPYTFAGLLDNRSGETIPSIVYRLGRLLAEEIRELRGLGYATFQLQEPLLVTSPPEGPTAESVRAAYGPIAEAADGATSTVWSFFGDAAPAFPLLASLPVTVVGIDLSETDPSRLHEPRRRIGLGLGCIDPRTTLREDPATLAPIVRELDARLRPASILLGPGAPLDLLPWESARGKLGLLPAAKALLARGAW
jgi:5-methyltetrahydropteroyltriglutamate--homocysteine methyltransferase